MGLISWWKASQAKAAGNRRSLAINDDESLIAEHAPELVGLGFPAAGALVLEELRSFRAACTSEQSAVLDSRLAASQQSWKADGLVMPYWGNLTVLREYQAELSATSTSS